MKLFFLLFSFVSVFFEPAYAISGHEVGNGGDVIVCRNKDGSIISVRFYDVYEGERRDLKLSLGGKDTDPKKQVKDFLEKFAEKSPIRAAMYLDWLRKKFVL